MDRFVAENTRLVGENTRLLYDIMKDLKTKDQAEILLLIGFEKAFETIEW